MKLSGKLLSVITLVLVIINLLFFFLRNSGFEYVKYPDTGELYPSDPNESFFSKWNKHNQQFSQEELKEGLFILNQLAGIDTMVTDEDKAVSIAAWLYKSFELQIGYPPDSIKIPVPLIQSRSLMPGKGKKIECGQYQALVGFFCTAAGLKNRYVAVVPVNAKHAGYHEVNEVYLSEIKKWVMVDATRNFLLIRKDHRLLSVAEYLNFRSQEQQATFFITRFDTASGITDTAHIKNTSGDVYFNKNYALRYYLNMNLSEVYSPVQKVKRYFFVDPWYEMYKPGKHHSNFLFRVRQFFIFGMGIFVLFYKFNSKKR
jgi:hypothetical protein